MLKSDRHIVTVDFGLSKVFGDAPEQEGSGGSKERVMPPPGVVPYVTWRLRCPIVKNTISKLTGGLLRSVSILKPAVSQTSDKPTAAVRTW